MTDSAASATSLCSGIKTYNGAINVDVDGKQVVPLARELQRDQDFMVGIVTSVPVSHATPAAAYANNVSRKDYQDIARDLVGLPSSAHREEALRGVDVLIGGGWGEGKGEDKLQGNNFAQGNPYFHQDDIRASDIKNGGRYRVVQRTEGKSGREILMDAAQKIGRQHRTLDRLLRNQRRSPSVCDCGRKIQSRAGASLRTLHRSRRVREPDARRYDRSGVAGARAIDRRISG